MGSTLPITRIGSGIESVFITSTGPRCGQPSKISSVSARTFGSKALMRRVEKARPQVLR